VLPNINQDIIDSNHLLQKVGRFGPIIGLVGLFIGFSVLSENFLTIQNQINILKQSSIIGILAIGVTFAILCAEIDLSIAAVMEFVGLTIATLAVGARLFTGLGMPVPLAILVGLLLGPFFGAVAGYVTARFDVPSFMTTLAILFLADGLGLIVSGGRPLRGIPESILMFGGATVAGFPVIILVFFGLLIMSQFILSYTRLGLYIYSIGGDRNATELIGINVRQVRLAVLTISGFFAGIAGLVMLGRIGSAAPQMGQNLLLPPIAAVILGGADLFGGYGNMGGTLVGVLILGILSNGLNLMGVDPSGQLVAQGFVLMLALLANVIGRK
jgi:ribose/xylose/arabinose/galactoside ABC-type transport system permease subunit